MPADTARLRAARPAGIAALALAGVAALTGCSSGSSSPASSTAAGPGAAPSPTSTCPVGRWSVSARDEFTQMGLDQLTGSGVSVTGGTIRVEFAADHGYVFRYDAVRLSVGDGAGSATVEGPVTGTWTLAGDRLTTTVTSSQVAVKVKVAGVTVSPSKNLDQTLTSGMPSAATVSCSGTTLVATVTAGAAAGQQVTFQAG